MTANKRYNNVLAQISASDDSESTLCLVCSHSTCHIRSHRSYSRRLLKQRSQQQSLFQSHTVLDHGIHNEKANPFANHPIMMDSRLEVLYNQLFSRWNHDFKGPERHLFPYSRYGAMLNGNADDKALLLGLFSVLATQLAFIRDGAPNGFALSLQLEVVLAQRKALLKDGASDARIATALCILCNSVHTDNKADLGDNVDVVKTMLRQRGGIEYLGMNGVLADNFMYIDHINSLVHNELPKFAIPQPYLSSASAPKGSSVCRGLSSTGLISEETAWSATLFTVLVRIYESAAQGACTSADKTYFAYLANVVEYQISVANAQHHDTDTLDECLVFALALFNNAIFRNSRDLVPSMPIFEQRFWRCLHSLRRRNLFHKYRLRHLEYYLACMGTISALRRRNSFQTETMEILAALRSADENEVKSFDQLCTIMDEFGWSKTTCLSLYANLWEQSSDHVIDKREQVRDEKESTIKSHPETIQRVLSVSPKIESSSPED